MNVLKGEESYLTPERLEQDSHSRRDHITEYLLGHIQLLLALCATTMLDLSIAERNYYPRFYPPTPVVLPSMQARFPD